MIPKNRTAVERAETAFKVREERKADQPLALAEYRAAQDEVLEKTRRLRAQRLAREAAGQ